MAPSAGTSIDTGGTLGRGDSFPLDNYKKGARVWLRDPEKVWIGAHLTEDVTFASKTIKLLTQDGQAKEITVTGPESLPFLRNPEILVGRDDLTSLSYLHEPAVLYNLHYRFVEQKTIYTYCGIVLVAINPYEDCSHLYGQEMIQVYRGVGKQVRGLDPHVYAVAEEAIFDMSEYGKNQSIIVSGESGAGKTVSAKFAMRYFAAVGSARSSSSLTGIEDRVLASNPIMEAIGNAKTIRNDNSSRFGKFIQINFTERFAIAGAEMKTYLLEKSRVVFQAQNERNYHVFYQMCAAKDDAMLKNLHLEDAVNYFYTGQGGHGRIAGVDDRADFAETTKAFGLLGINADQQKDIFRVLAGLLQLGNISFASGGDEIAVVEASMQQGIKRLCSDLYEIDSTALDTWLTVREIRAAGDTLRKPLNTSEAIASRDALAKVLYSAVFAWIVHKVNESLVEKAPTPSPRKQHVDPMSTATPATPTTSSKGNRFIGVLDIYGFETFDINSFEQFCINYANEKLQQQFNQHVFKLEQEEYEREEIAWVRIDFYDNQPCIDLIEDKLGLIDLLDEQCRMGRGTDVDWLNQLRSSVALKTKPHFELPKIQEPAFIVKHFAADVTYRVDGFLDKNKDTVSEQLLEVIKKSKFPFLREILGVEEQTATNGTGYSAVRVTNDSGPQKKQNKKTVSCQFRDSLRDLMMILGSTRPHYVRCIKPNDQKASFTFDPKRAIQQLRACGVLETVRISAAGYPSRWLYDDFGKRYRVLYPEGKAMWRDQPKKFAEKACAKWIDDHSKFALGKSKIFFRTGQVAQLERLRSETLAKSALVIQKIWRGYVARQRYLKIRASIRTIQAVGRAFLAYRRMKYIQMHRAAVCLQRRVRGWLARVKYVRARKTVLALQSLYRANLVRRRVQKLRYEQKAIIIQKYCRGWLVRRSQIEYKRKVIKVQSCVRRWLAKRRLRELKVEARSVGHLQKLNSGLENKIISLQLKLDQASLDNGKLVDQCADVEKLRVEVAHMTTLKGEMTSLKDKHDELEQEVERLATECDIKDAHLTEAQTKLEQMNIQLEQLTAQHEREMAALQAAVDGGRSAALQLSAAKDKLESQLENESRKREHAEQRVSLLSEQLMSNANLLAGSPGLSRVGSMRGSRSPIPLDLNQGTLGDKDELLLTIRQQRLITELTARNEHLAREREQLRSLMEANSQLADMERKTSLRLFEAQRVQELEVAYAKLKSELERLVEEKTSKGADKMNIQSLVDRTLEENDRRREESAELRALLASRFEKHTSPRPDSGHSSSHSDDESTLSDIEDELCLERQCREQKRMIEDLTRQLEDRDRLLTEMEEKWTTHQNMTFPPLTPPDDTPSDDALQTIVHGELNRLVSENMTLQNRIDRQTNELMEARAQLRGYSGVGNLTLESTTDSEIVRLESLRKEDVEHSALLEVFNVPEFCRILVCDLKPRLARLLTPCLPSYLMLTGYRFQDHAKDEAGLTGLFNTLHVALKDTVARSHDLDVLAMWLVNSWRLLNLLRQYSGENQTEWGAGNTEKQKGHCIQNFDLAPFREKLRARVEECYQNFMKRAVEPVLSPKIVPGILQHESSQELQLTASTTTNGAGQNGLSRQSSKDHVSLRALDDLIALLGFVHSKLGVFGADPVLLGQVFGQITSWTCALALNHLMFRKELCNFEKAIQIKHNVTEIQSWLHEKGLGEFRETLEPLVQASHLLQSKKDESNLDTLTGEMTSKLKPKQIIALLQHYAPSDGFEERRLPAEFLAKVSERLATERSNIDEESPIMMGTYLTPFDTTPFIHSDYRLESISLPTCLHLQNVARLL